MRALSLAAFAVSFLCSLSASAQVWPSLERAPAAEKTGTADVALLIAVEDYAYLPDVPGAKQNLVDWETFLRDGLGVETVLRLVDGQAAREDILDTAKRAAKMAKKGGTVWLLFIGHGAPNKDGTDGLLIGADGRQTPTSIAARGVPQSALIAAIEGGKQARTVIVFDACFSGRDRGNKTLAKGVQPVLPVASKPAVKQDTIVLTAARSDEFAGDLPGYDRPAFSYLLLGAMHGWANGGDNIVTAQEAVRYADRKLLSIPGRQQTPELIGRKDAILTRGVSESLRPTSPPVTSEDVSPPDERHAEREAEKEAVPPSEAPETAPHPELTDAQRAELERMVAAGADPAEVKRVAMRMLLGESADTDSSDDGPEVAAIAAVEPEPEDASQDYGSSGYGGQEPEPAAPVYTANDSASASDKRDRDNVPNAPLFGSLDVGLPFGDQTSPFVPSATFTFGAKLNHFFNSKIGLRPFALAHLYYEKNPNLPEDGDQIRSVGGWSNTSPIYEYSDGDKIEHKMTAVMALGAGIGTAIRKERGNDVQVLSIGFGGGIALPLGKRCLEYVYVDDEKEPFLSEPITCASEEAGSGLLIEDDESQYFDKTKQRYFFARIQYYFAGWHVAVQAGEANGGFAAALLVGLGYDP